jgi:hypothetical protein
LAQWRVVVSRLDASFSVIAARLSYKTPNYIRGGMIHPVGLHGMIHPWLGLFSRYESYRGGGRFIPWEMIVFNERRAGLLIARTANLVALTQMFEHAFDGRDCRVCFGFAA